MAGRRDRGGATGSPEGGPARVGCKGKNFVRVEEEQLCKSVMLVSQDRVVGNQQKAGVFWERITEHYNENRPEGVRPLRSLETKWGLIKHNVSKFCGIYNQIERLHKSGSNAADTMRDAKELYRQKSAKNSDFLFEHCWLLLKDCPRWADGWTQPSIGKKRVANDCEGSNSHGVDVDILGGYTRSQSVYNERPGGVKSAKQDSMQQKVRDGALYAQAEATRSMAAVQMRKVAVIEDQNMLLLMTMPIEESAGEDAREYMRLRRGEELKKLKKRLSAEDCALQTEAAREVEDPDVLSPRDEGGRRDPGASASQAGRSQDFGDENRCPPWQQPPPAAARGAFRVREEGFCAGGEGLWEGGAAVRVGGGLQTGGDEGRVVDGRGGSEGAGGGIRSAGGRRRGARGCRRAADGGDGVGAGGPRRTTVGRRPAGERPTSDSRGCWLPAAAAAPSQRTPAASVGGGAPHRQAGGWTAAPPGGRYVGAPNPKVGEWRAAGIAERQDAGEWDPEVEGREWERGEEMVEEEGDGVAGEAEERRGLPREEGSAVAPPRRGAADLADSEEPGCFFSKKGFSGFFGLVFHPAPAAVCWRVPSVCGEVEIPPAAPHCG